MAKVKRHPATQRVLKQRHTAQNICAGPHAANLILFVSDARFMTDAQKAETAENFAKVLQKKCPVLIIMPRLSDEQKRQRVPDKSLLGVLHQRARRSTVSHIDLWCYDPDQKPDIGTFALSRDPDFARLQQGEKPIEKPVESLYRTTIYQMVRKSKRVEIRETLPGNMFDISPEIKSLPQRLVAQSL